LVSSLSVAFLNCSHYPSQRKPFLDIDLLISDISYLNVGKGSWGEDELVESTEKGSHEGVGLGDVNLAGVVKVEFSPGSWEEFTHVGLHLGLRDLLGDKEDLGACLLASILIEDLVSSWLTGSIGDWDGVVVEDVVHDIVLVGTEISRGWGSLGSWWWGLVLEPVTFLGAGNLDGIGCAHESSNCKDVSEFHF